jgi:hypothetical protein
MVLAVPQKLKHRAGGVTQVVESLHGKCKALSLNVSAT